MIALDASALLALLFGEPGRDRVAEAAEGSCISAVNLAEVLGRFARDGHDPREVLRRIEETPLEIVPFGAEQAVLAAALVPPTTSRGLALGDRCCLALAVSRAIPAMTADRAWAGLDLGIEIVLVR